MKIITIALLMVSLHSYADSIEECNEKASFEKETMAAALSGITIRDYLEGIDRSKWEHAILVYENHNAVSHSKINGNFQATTAEFHFHTTLESDSITCYRDALGMKYPFEKYQED